MINKTTTKLVSYGSWRNEFMFEYGDHYLINKKDISLFSQIEQHRNNKIDSKDTVYFTKASKLPRFKYKEYIENKKINPKKTNRIDYADTFILSINELKGELLKSFAEYCTVPVLDIRSSASTELKDYIIKHGITEVLILKEMLIHWAETTNNFPLSKTKINSYTVDEYNKAYTGWGSGTIESYIDIYNYLESKLNSVKIIFDESFSEEMNEGLIIDEEVYNNIANMLSSDDSNNISMGIEIISNCDFKQSNIYILLLINEFWKKFNSKNITANFKNCLNYFKQYSFGFNWDKFVGILINELRSDEDKKAINKYIKRQLNNKYKDSFKIEEIKIKGLD